MQYKNKLTGEITNDNGKHEWTDGTCTTGKLSEFPIDWRVARNMYEVVNVTAEAPTDDVWDDEAGTITITRVIAPPVEPEPIPETVINSAINLQTEIGRVNATYNLTLGIGSGYDETFAQLLNNDSISEITRVLEYDRLTNRYNEYAYHYQRWQGGGDPWEGLAEVAESLQNQ